MRHAILITALVAGCTSLPETPAVVWFGNPLQVWELTELNGKTLDKSTRYAATLRLNPDHSVAGTLACNSLSKAKLQWEGQISEGHGTFNRKGNSAGIMTAAGCGNRAAVSIGSRFWTAAETARFWSIDGERLTIVFDDGSTARLSILTQTGN